MIGTSFQREILKKLSDLGPLYIVGGAVRDAQLGIPAKDVDVVTTLPLQEIEIKLSDWGYTPHVIGAHLQTVSLFKETERLDIASFSGEVEKDALRRDFTLNAIYQDVRTGEIKDPLGGLQDLDERRLRACGCAVDRFVEDPLRIMRLIRLSVRYGFEIEQETWQAAVDNLSLLHKVSSERVTEELARILVLEEIDKALGLLDDLGYWQMYIPELARLKGLVQNRYHTKDAWEHTRHVVRNTPNRVLLRLAALFHDMGKWETASRECYVWGTVRLTNQGYQVEGFKLVDKNLERWKDKNVEVRGGRLDNYPDTIVIKRITATQAKAKKHFELVPAGKRHFLQHERESARLVREILPRFQWSMVLPGGNKGERELEYLVGHHMVGTLTFMSALKGEAEHPKVRSKMRHFAWEIGWNGQVYNKQRVEDLLDLWRADFLGGKQVEEETIERFNWIQEQIRSECAFLLERDNLLNWAYFGEYTHGKGLEGEKFGQFKEQVRRQVMLDAKNNLNDPRFLEREYGFFKKS
ncbi:CCA tRNA nucleotidyltransferase [Desulfosporosinus metallidurans]|uniref:tRNA nucleotidyltransferase n=1 Tax=Desulfosporosinus metallidurans TaxID=1888891 RepID=A0A1Q8QZT3_9FIRM|nr:CCA tRNA nucleotidyltransferase [Desulfosporosinus metallidurans]OLN32873.1 tRNA nucleotidyltransferase [Desulfosporosinus metallidurans]